MKNTRSFKIFAPIIALFLFLISTSTTVLAQSKSYYWESFDVEVTVLENGDLLVTEHQVINFSGAPFTYGFRAVKTGRQGNNEGILDVRVREGDTVYQQSSDSNPHTYRVMRNSTETEISWYFPAATGARSYTISYRVKGAIRTEPSGDQVFWNALPADLGARINNSTIAITLPEQIQAASTTAEYGGREDSRRIQTTVSPDGRRVVFQLLEPRPIGTDVEVGVRFPSGQLQLTPPAWQIEEQKSDVRNLIFIVIGAFLAVAGPLFVLMIWYLFGRDPQIGPIPDYLSEPPDDLPPAIAGTLIDERAHIHDVMSTVIDLARRGYLTMTETKRDKDYTFERTDKPLDDLRSFEREMIEGIFSGKKSRKLDSLRYKFSERLPEIRGQLYEELKNYGYVRTSPENVRSRFGCLSAILISLTFLTFFGLGSLFGDGTPAIICPSIAIGLTAVIMVILGRYMPAKTEKGAEAAARWLAFKNYLYDIEKYTDLNEATEIFERYLAYAVAFGLEQTWIRKFASIPSAPIPPWYVPYPHHGAGGTSAGRGGRNSRRSSAPSSASGRPSLEGMSGSVTGGLTAMSGGLTRMLTNTQTVLQSTRSSSSGSSGSFSGGFSGGSSGGGSGGFG